MKHIIYTTLFGLLVSFFACTDEASINPGDNNTSPEVPEGMAQLNISFKGLGQTRSYADLKGTDLENQLDSVRFFIFKDKVLMGIYTAGVTEDGEDKVATTLIRESGTLDIIAVANPADSIVSNDWDKDLGLLGYDAFIEGTTLQHDSMPHPSLLMSAVQNGGTLTVTQGSTINVTFELVRLVSRIDILNRDSVGTRPFELQKARLTDIPSVSYLYGTAGTPDNANLLTDLDWVDLIPAEGSNHKMFSQLYTYVADSGVVSLEVSGLYNGNLNNYLIPLTKDLIANHRYVVVIDSVTPIDIFYDIVVSDWTADTIRFTPEAGMQTKYEVDAADLSKLRKGVNGAPDTLLIGDRRDSVSITVNSSVKDIRGLVSEDWTAIEADGSITSYATEGFAQKFKLKLPRNIGDAREGVVYFYNSIDPSSKTPIIISQKAGILGKWAHQNLSDVGVFVNDGIAFDNPSDYGVAQNYGAWFQFGRNYVFENTNIMPDTTSTKIPFEDGATNSKFIINPTTYLWHTEAGTANDTWYKLTNSAYANTDPCPAGYRLPTPNEILEVMPANSTEGTFATTTVTIANSGNLSERTGNNLTVQTAPGKYIGVGVAGSGSTQTRTVYGVKNAETDSAYVLRWTRVGNGTNPEDDSTAGNTYLQIDCKPNVGSDFVVTDASSFEGLDWTTGDVVTRYFPAAGCRHYGTGAASGRGSFGYYWSSTASSAGFIWGLLFEGTNARLNNFARVYGLSVRCVIAE